MASFNIHLMGQTMPLVVDLEFTCIDELAEAVAQSRFVIGNLTEPDEDGVCRRVMVATGRIQCAVEAD